jgi:predicted nucleotidyltransferase component of viral defense system
MIAKDYITEWREHAPWISDAHVEQDLVISRALIEIFRVEELARRLAFRGGTALFKLHLRPAVRYSEDIDLVQITPEPIGETFDATDPLRRLVTVAMRPKTSTGVSAGARLR